MPLMPRLVAIAMALGLFGCRSEIVDKIEGFADRVCACPDEACALEVQSDYLEWQAANSSARGSEKERKRVEDALARYSECHRKLVTEALPEASPEPAPAPKAPEPNALEDTPANSTDDTGDPSEQ